MLLKNRCLFTLGLILAIVFILLFVANSHQALAGNATVKSLGDMPVLAEQGNSGAQFNLGYMYHEGEGVPQDYKEALKWYRKSAEQGNAKAQNNLGYMYYNGKGVPKNYIRAYAWCNLAASQGDDSFAKFRDALAEEYMTNQQIASAQELSVELQNKIENRSKTTTSDTEKQ